MCVYGFTYVNILSIFVTANYYGCIESNCVGSHTTFVHVYFFLNTIHMFAIHFCFYIKLNTSCITFPSHFALLVVAFAVKPISL